MNIKNTAKDVVLISFLSATLVVGKLALLFASNVECVSFLIIVYTAALGLKRGGSAAVVFALTDGLIYGYGYYTVTYLIQYPGLALVTALVSLRRARSEYVYTLVAFVMAVFFGLHSALLDCAVLGVPFGPRYWSGLPFYAASILSACLLTLFAFKPACRALKAQAARYYGHKGHKKEDTAV
jgi:membrane protein implicated in regulation of membrane protease activity